MIHLDSVIFWGLASGICFIIAGIFYKINENPEPVQKLAKTYSLGDSLTIPRTPPPYNDFQENWTKAAQEYGFIKLFYEDPKIIKVVNDKIQTRTTKRIRKGTNSRVKKAVKKKRSRNKTITKTIGLRSK